MEGIKFRLFGKNSAEFLRPENTGLNLKELQNVCDIDLWHVMQYTGFQDSKGNNIYDGDIVNIKNDGYADVIAQVVFDIAAFWLYSEHIHLAYTEDADNMIRLSTIYMDTGADGYLAQLEVIGNIHENRELIDKN